MAKQSEIRIDPGLFGLDIVIPEPGKGRDLFKHNSWLKKCCVVRQDEFSREPELERVFENPEQGDNPRIALYVVLMGWRRSPLRNERSFEDMQIKAMDAAGISWDSVSESPVGQGQMWRGDLSLLPGQSTGWGYFSKFVEYQRDFALGSLRSTQSIRHKLDEFYNNQSLLDYQYDDMTKMLAEMRAYTSEGLRFAQEASRIQSIILGDYVQIASGKAFSPSDDTPAASALPNAGASAFVPDPNLDD